MDESVDRIANELGLTSVNVRAVAALLDGGATVPFVARYRKEATGSMDEVGILSVKERLTQLRHLDERLGTMQASLEERGLLTDELDRNLRGARTITELEDLYLPHRPKRRTRATQAIEKGLEPLAQALLADPTLDPQAEAAKFVNGNPTADGGVPDVKAALDGARDALDRSLTGDPDGPVFEALGRTIERYDVPLQHFIDLIDGVRMDLTISRYATFTDLRAYCYRVASVVGMTTVHIFGYESDDALELAEKCGVAFQLTNILRDIREDAELGRVYLPAEELARFGLTPDDLLAKRGGTRFRELMEFQCNQIGRASCRERV